MHDMLDAMVFVCIAMAIYCNTRDLLETYVCKRKVGGLTFLKVGRLTVSWSISKRRV